MPAITDKISLHTPSLLTRLAIQFCHRLPLNWLGLRIIFIIRKAILIFCNQPFYILAEGAHFLLYPKDNLSDKRLLCCPQMLDGAERNWLSSRLRQNTVVVDVGANIGGYSLLLKNARKDLSVYAIEPDPYLFKRLQHNLQLNDFNDFHLLECAVTDQNKNISLTIDLDNRGKNKVADVNENKSNQQTIVGKSLQNILIEQNIKQPELIKLDIEGHELSVLKAFFETQKDNKLLPRFIQLEQYRGQDLNPAAKLILNNGYQKMFRGRMNMIFERLETHTD